MVTSTVGGAISGNSVIGSARYEIAPSRLRMTERTAAKIGRSTKKCENRIRVVSDPDRRISELLIAGFDLAVLGLDLLTRPRASEPFDNDAVTGIKT